MVAVMFALTTVACSDDTGTKKVDQKVIKLDNGLPTEGIVLPDNGPKTEKKPGEPAMGTCDATKLGKTCTKSGGECGATATCLLTDSAGTKGVCSCKCTLDDSSTPLVNEDSCPELSKNRCVDQSDTKTPDPWCMALCDPKLGTNTCATGLSCIPWIGPYLGVYDKSICIIEGCKTDAECPVSTNTKCSIAAKDCPTGQTCTTYLGTTVSGDEGRCQLPGKCDTVSGLCTDHALGKATAKIGDPCKDDRDCANNMECRQEFDRSKYQKKGGEACTDDLQCCSGTCNATSKKCDAGLCTVSNRNGYCTMSDCAFSKTLTSRACPTGSFCHKWYPGGSCFKGCDMTKAADCRGNAADLYGDYECRNYGAYFADPSDSTHATPLLTSPICERGAEIPCDAFTTSKLDCSYCGTFDSAGKATNATNYKCRGYDGATKTNAADPYGLCLDDSASGTTYRSPLPTP